MPYPKSGVAFTFDVNLVDASARPSFRANPTLAVGDVTVSTDEGAFANMTTLPTVTPAAGTNVKGALSAAEMTGSRVVIRFIDQTVPKEWDDRIVSIYTTVVTVDDLVRSTTPANTLAVSAAGRAEADVKLWLAAAPAALTASGYLQTMLLRWLTDNAGGTPSALIANRPDVIASVMGVDALDSTALAASAAAEIADKLLGRNLAGGLDGTRTVQDALRVLRNRRAIAAGVLTVYQENDIAAAWTAPVTTAAGNPLIEIDPV